MFAYHDIDSKPVWYYDEYYYSETRLRYEEHKYDPIQSYHNPNYPSLYSFIYRQMPLLESID